MSDKILFVDDEPNVLSAIRRQLRNRFNADFAQDPVRGLTTVAENGPFAVVVSDLRMPGMDGIEFLSRARRIAPDTVRIILTGNADLNAAVEAVNEGSIFRFLTKPIPEDALRKVLSAGLKQYHLIRAEKELLEKTLMGSIEVMTDLLSMANPEAFGRSLRLKRCVSELATHMGVEDTWKLETAAMLSQIGALFSSRQTLQGIHQGRTSSMEESAAQGVNSEIAADLLNNIPRLEDVSEIILYQHKLFNGQGRPEDKRRFSKIPLGARILKVALDFDQLENRGLGEREAFEELKNRPGWYDPEVLRALRQMAGVSRDLTPQAVEVSQLKTRMILEEDVFSRKGQLLISRGQELSEVALKRLKHFHRNSGIQEPVRVLVTKKTK